MEEEIKKMVANGWIRCWAAIEVLGTSAEVTKTALRKHVAKIKREKAIRVYKEDWARAIRAKNPPAGISKAWSQVVELEFVIKNISSLVRFAMLYAPSAVEILEPNEIRVGAGEAQAMVNDVAALVHRYAAKIIGGIPIAGK